MKKYALFLIFMLYVIISYAQKYDYQWIFGYGDYKEKGFGITLMDFNGGDVDVSYYRGSVGYKLGFTGSIIDNEQGEIILHTNNCEVRDTDWIVISGDGLITPTSTGANTCTDGGNEFGAYQSTIFLPDLKDENIIYLVHKDLDIDFDAQDAYTNNMWISTINKIDGKYNYSTSKKICEKKQIGLRLTACPNRTKDAWWVLMPDNKSNVFRKYLISSDTMIEYESQAIGFKLNVDDIDIGQAQYSPDGRVLGINSEEHGVLLYDFDNETGMLSNFRNIPYPDSKNVAQGLCFSPSNRFIYVATAENVYQIDLQQNNEVYHIGYFRSFDGDGWPVGLGMIFCGPDCKLYVSPGTTTYYLHVILRPDEKGSDCKFTERAIELPTNLPHHLPNLPQYRYLSGCDTTIVFPFEVSVTEGAIDRKETIAVYPNPASDALIINYNGKSEISGKITVYNTDGRLMLDKPIQFTGRYDSYLNVTTFATGIYMISITDENNAVIYKDKFIKIK